MRVGHQVVGMCLPKTGMTPLKVLSSSVPDSFDSAVFCRYHPFASCFGVHNLSRLKNAIKAAYWGDECRYGI